MIFMENEVTLSNSNFSKTLAWIVLTCPQFSESFSYLSKSLQESRSWKRLLPVEEGGRGGGGGGGGTVAALEKNQSFQIKNWFYTEELRIEDGDRWNEIRLGGNDNPRELCKG